MIDRPSLRESFLLVIALLTSSHTVPAAAQSTSLNSAVLIYDHKTLIAAPEVVERIAAMGDQRLAFVVTIHCRLSPKYEPIEFGLMGDRYKSWSASSNFSKLDDELLGFYRQQLTSAFRKAVELGMDIAVLPHLDPAGDVLAWRNHFEFNPSKLVKGYSYETAVIDSCLVALNASSTKQTRIEFSLSGEMGRSLFAHPDEYRRLLQKISKQLPERSVAIGVSLNHNDVAGGHKPKTEQLQSLQKLLDDCNFLGFSNYHPFELPPRTAQFTEDCQFFLKAISGYGLTVPPETPLHFSEIGLGGAPDKQGNVTPERAAAEPWEGIARGNKNPWASTEMADLRRKYHTAVLTFLRTQPGPRRVEKAYFWSEGSWDPLGIDRPQFADELIRRQIIQHNAQSRE